jgi:hypothetical protein
MAEPLKAGMAPDLIIDGSYKVRLTAVDATTGAVVAGVIVSEVAIQATDLVGSFSDQAPMPMLVPSDQVV